MKASRNRTWLRVILVSILWAFILDLGLFIYGSSVADHNIYAGRTYTWVWLLFSILALVLSLSKLRVRPGYCLLMISVGALFYASLWHPLLENVNLLKPNYIGIILLGNADQQQVAGTDQRSKLSFLYASSDPELTAFMNGMRSEGTEFKLKKFLFWQTGIGYGFGQKELPYYYELRGYRFYRLALIATVGPVVLYESILNGILKAAAIILLVQWAWFYTRKRHLLIR